jgi:hypothetical protein|eukprot:SAG25_NODE_285_length_10382_cov_55.777108_2_plen_57_part_00
MQAGSDVVHVRELYHGAVFKSGPLRPGEWAHFRFVVTAAERGADGGCLPVQQPGPL